ncbi:tRNA adenosine(34) deaminase TadA [Levilactobacillus bambusae]|uniref:tRNA-specific adenosine deaminase n=1 Tax=Levilactobacillus bambusae TaxID=2024736 RepID=A0A2V1MXX5_9LACO|nr:tRNA adenosine(34) deaminase TadA [Levilactobacillus bambusae]PWF99387.1 tRNA-specific adenosine deaminase [Levilactobacillus bambusae]
MFTDRQRFFMAAALDEAKQAAIIGEVPIGAVVVHHDQIIGRGHNLREHSEDATDHAEMIAIREANATLKSWRLVDCQIYVTIEPCPMCSGAILNSRLPELFYGAPDVKAGTVDSLYQLLNDDRFNHQVQVHQGLLADEAAQEMKTFFKAARKRRKAARQANKK